MTDARQPHGAYGLALPGLPGTQWLNPAGAEWVEWSFTQHDEAAEALLTPSESVAVVRHASGRAERIDRDARATTLYGAPAPPAHAYVHPILSNTAAAHAEWSANLCFHAGCFLDRHGRAWGLLGDRELGKSSALAWMSAHDIPIVADDMVITDGEHVMAGPRCIDLREPTARRYEIGADIGVVGTRRRWRVDLPAVPAETVLGGWVVLGWGEDVELAEVAAAERGNALADGLAVAVARHPLPWLGVMARPMLRLSRPRSWDRVDQSMEVLLAGVARAGQR